jgi:hypothetical protein
MTETQTIWMGAPVPARKSRGLLERRVQAARLCDRTESEFRGSSEMTETLCLGMVAPQPAPSRTHGLAWVGTQTTQMSVHQSAEMARSTPAKPVMTETQPTTMGVHLPAKLNQTTLAVAVQLLQNLPVSVPQRSKTPI